MKIARDELIGAVRNGVAILDALFEYADIRLAALAVAGDDEVALGDKPETGHLGASITICSRNGINYFLHLELPPNFLFAFRQGTYGTAGVHKQTSFWLLRKSTTKDKIIAWKSRIICRKCKKAEQVH